ncbi:MAG: hypothetical protein HY472_00445, partial [Candidatus Sungbacteria bacterium]|nr:hypothetical protein [Candidatus Sungbacteria bacterium]
MSETLLSDRCRVTGWAVDPDNPDRKVDIKIYAEGQLVGSLQANQYRNTLLNVCPGGACGFTFDLSPHIKKGQTYTIRTRAIDVNTAEEINLFDTPHNLRCVDPPPTLSLAPVLPVSITSNFIPYASVGISKSPQDPFTSNITVTRGVPTSIYLTARRSDDSNGWTHPQFGVSNGGRCEWNSDLNQGTPTFERTINNPASAQSCDISLGNLTFNDAPGTYTYQVLRIVDAAGAVSRTDTIRVRVENPPSASIFADGRDNAYTIPFGARDKTVNLNWGCSGFNLLPPDASGSWSGQKAFGGNERTPPLSPGIHTYTITCRDAQGGSASDTIVVTVEAPPAQVTVDLKANGQDGTLNLAYNSSATLSWTSSSNTTSCRAGGVWAGNKSSNGSESTGNLAPAVSRTYTYSLTCSDNHPSTPDATDTVHVSVQGWLNSFVTPSPPTPSPPPPPASTNRLPTGYHDGARGQVALSQCRAFGWATDPDDPSRPVNVGVRVGGGSFRTIVPANQFRQDLQNANVCPQGRCAFDIDLTPYISDSSSREVRVEALDLQNGTPTLLSNSPKAITCSQPVSPPPLTLTSSCPAPGTQATLSWTPVPGTHHYALRVNDLRDGWDGTCSSPNGDFCKDVFPLVYVFPSTPQTSYSWWVHPCNSAGVCGEAVNQQFVCASAPNRAPIADARIDTIQGAFTKPNNNTIAVTQGVPTPVYLSARFSNDPDNWTDPINGVSNGGRCEWNSDLNQGTPTFERIINNPASAQSCDTYLGNLTFNDAPGTYTYQVLRIVDRQGGASIGSVSVSVVRPAVVAPPPVTTGTIIIKRVGADETTGSAPQGSHARIDPFPLQSQNPVTFPNLATGNYTASVVDLPGFTETYGVCFYAPGSPECSVTAISSTPACNGTSCSLPFQIIAPFTRKVVVKYVPTPTRIGIPQPIITTSCVGTQPRATISWQNAQRPAGYWVDIDTDNNWNNGFWNKQVQSAITTLAPDGFNPGFGAQGPLPFASGSGYYVRVWYENTNEHSPTAAFNTPQCVPPQSIGTISIFRVDQSGNLFTAASTAGRVNQLSPQSQNPALFTNLPAAGYTISATDLREYTETYGVCNYAPGTPECTVNSFPITPACDGVFCSVSGQFLAAPLIRKVVFKYDLPIAVTPPPQSGTIIIKRVGADETTGSAPQGSHARIDPFPLQSQNPVTFPNLATGNYTASVVDLPG